MIKNFKLFVNKNDESLKLANLIKLKFIDSGFKYDEDNFDLGISVGGDGSFLRMVKNTEFDSLPYYVGVNTGTLGFLQEVKPNQVSNLINEIKNNRFYTELIGIQETNIIHGNKTDHFYSLNEVLVKGKDDKLIRVAVNINDELLENFTGDGLLIATSTGSTAQNLSYGGCIVFSDFSTLQITPIGPINSQKYRTLPNSVIIPDYANIRIIPNKNYKDPSRDSKDFKLTIDGEQKNYTDVSEINTSIKDKKIKMLRFSHYSFPQKINEKLLSK